MFQQVRERIERKKEKREGVRKKERKEVSGQEWNQIWIKIKGDEIVLQLSFHLLLSFFFS